MSQILTDRGHEVKRLHYRECIHGPGRNVPAWIRKGEITGIFISYHRRKLKSVPLDKIKKFNDEMNVWIKHAIELNLDVYILGITGSHWENTVGEIGCRQGVV